MVNFIRASSLEGFAELATSAGADPVRLCQAVGIPDAALTDPEVRIRVDALGMLLDLAARQTGVEDLALRLASRRRPSTWGAPGLLMTMQQTVFDALQEAVRYFPVHADGMTADIQTYGEEVRVCIDVEHDADALGYDPAQRNELAVGSPVFILRHLMRRDWRPVRVGFTHSVRGSVDRYRPYFGRTPDFDQDRLHFVALKEDFDAELPGYDPEAERLMRHMAEQQLPDRPLPFSRAVALTISQRLTEGTFSAVGVAGTLDLDLRTLQRRLAAEGTSFSELLYTVRKDLARTYVESSRRPLVEVADLLGFASLSAFSQWYSRAHGQSAAERRTRRP